MKYSLLKKTTKKFHFLDKLEEETLLAGSKALDLGCGKQSPIKFFSNKLKYSLGVDNYEQYIALSKSQNIHTDYIISDVLEACEKIKTNSFDCVLALDLIEHLSRNDGLKLIKEMERVAKHKLIIYTPNGYLAQGILDDNRHQHHLSGWKVGEMKKLGFKVFGMSGLKFLRKEEGKIKWRPIFFWQKISSFTQLFVYFFPQLSFQILCIKDI